MPETAEAAAERAIDDPAVLARLARLVRVALQRKLARALDGDGDAT